MSTKNLHKGDTVTLLVTGAGTTSEEPRVVASVNPSRGTFQLENDDHRYSLSTGWRVDDDSIFGFVFRVKELENGSD